MSARHFSFQKKTDLFLVLVCLLILLPCLYYPYAGVHPNFGFALNTTDWRVLTTSGPCPETSTSCLKSGDQVVSIEGVRHSQFSHDRSLSVRGLFGADGVARIELIRDGKLLIRDVKVRAKRVDAAQVFFTMMAPLIFWLMGTIAVIFLRPRDERWLILVLFSYNTALWIAAGLAVQAAFASHVFHAVIWFFLPLSIHLHTILPSELFSRGFRRGLLAVLYLAAAVLVVLDALFLLQKIAYLSIWYTLAAVALSVGLLLLRLVLPVGAAAKIAARIMIFGVVLGLVPFLVFHGAFVVWIKHLVLAGRDLNWFLPYMIGISSISVPILPMAYIYAIYKHHLGSLEFRADRLLGIYTFSALIFVSYTMVFFGLSGKWENIRGDFLAAVFVVSLLYVALTPFLRDRFQQWVDRHVFGIKHSAEDVIGLVSERIPTAFDRDVLAGVLAEEILPALLIRQSALYLLEDGRREALYEQSVPPGEPEPTMEELLGMLEKGGRYLPPGDPAGTGRSWVRLVIPLAVQGRPIGVWLIGRRDPDDYFPAIDIHLLSTVANQIAPMVENVRLYEKAQAEIAQRKAAEEAIRRSEERFRTLFEATLEGIAIVRNGVILEVNNAMSGIFGYPPEEIIGRRLTDLVSGEVDLEGVPRESIGFTRGGGTADIEIAGKRYVFQGEEVSVVAIRDIARRKRDEAENKMLQRQLLHSAKMEAIGRLSAGVAHDFNNCLLAIFGYSDLLLERHAEDVFLSRNLTGIKEAGQRAAALTKQLLAFARRQPMETKVLNANAVVSGLEKMLRRLLGEDIHLITELHPELGKVKVDPGQIEQVIVNLVVNARHAMPKGGRLTLRTTPVEITPEKAGEEVPHPDVPQGSYVLLTVADTGVGMDAATQARVFEPFFSTKGEGTGLGLSTAYGIVRQSGGYIFVQSAPGEGASFSIYLPVTHEAETVRTGIASGGSDRGSETILLVEDEDEVRAVLHQILVSKGYRVLQAGSGEEALVISRLHRGTVQLLLTDVTMPQMKGPELAQRLRAERPSIRVLFMSGYNDERLSGGGIEAPVCLQKPFAPNLLGETIRSLLDAAEDLRAAV